MGGEGMTPEQRRERYQNMSPEEHERMRGARMGGGRGGNSNMSSEQMQEMRKRFENMTPEEREQMRSQRQQGGGGHGGHGASSPHDSQ